jgi:uncharacterized protein YjiS (DUF1127 family)
MDIALERNLAAARPPRVCPLCAVFRLLAAWQDRARQRRHLAELDDRLLADMGIGRGDAAREAAKPFWSG